MPRYAHHKWTPDVLAETPEFIVNVVRDVLDSHSIDIVCLQV
jgi:hypothetical protein